jgi:hypothetical protein
MPWPQDKQTSNISNRTRKIYANNPFQDTTEISRFEPNSLAMTDFGV